MLSSKLDCKPTSPQTSIPDDWQTFGDSVLELYIMEGVPDKVRQKRMADLQVKLSQLPLTAGQREAAVNRADTRSQGIDQEWLRTAEVIQAEESRLVLAVLNEPMPAFEARFGRRRRRRQRE